MRSLPAGAKLNLALVVGPRRAGGKHEVATVLQTIALADSVSLGPGSGLLVTGFPDDTLVTRALRRLAEAAGSAPAWLAHVEKRIPVAAGLGGGSSDAAAALRLANETLDLPVSNDELRVLAAELGADVPFFLVSGPQLGLGDGSELTPLDVPQDYAIVLVLPHGAEKRSTASVYEGFDARGAERGFEERRANLLAALGSVRFPRDLAALPPNDLASSPVAGELLALGAFRADVTGAGPAVYGLFEEAESATTAARVLERQGQTWLTAPAWYG